MNISIYIYSYKIVRALVSDYAKQKEKKKAQFYTFKSQIIHIS